MLRFLVGRKERHGSVCVSKMVSDTVIRPEVIHSGGWAQHPGSTEDGLEFPDQQGL